MDWQLRLRQSLVMTIDLEFVKGLAQQAARLALDSAGSFRAELKSDDSWVTNVDREIESFLKAEIQQRYPGHTLFGEETGFTSANPQSRSAAEIPTVRDSIVNPQSLWLIDPIDGTTNFVKRIPAWCVSIGYVENGEPTLGVIAVPPLNEFYWATKGGGAFWSRGSAGVGERLHARDVDELHVEDTVGVSSDALKGLPLSRLTGRIRNLGSAAVDAVYIARGSLLASIYFSEKAHDLAAGLCICREAGCEARWLSDGRELKITELIGRASADDHYLVGPPNAVRLLRQSLTSKS